MARLFFELFKKSPFGPLHNHMVKVRECIGLLKPLFEAVLRGDAPDRIEKIADQISRVEHQADEIKNEIRLNLPSHLFLPVNREDLLAYLHVQDDIADAVEDVSVLLTLKPLRIPASLHADILAFVDKVLEVCRLCDEAEEEFARLVSSAFGEAERGKVLQIVAKAEYAEFEADKTQSEAAKKLLGMEKEMSPVDIFLLFQAFGVMGKVANHAEKTGDRIRRLMVKS